jgi:hypothetical protein
MQGPCDDARSREEDNTIAALSIIENDGIVIFAIANKVPNKNCTIERPISDSALHIP